MVPLTGVDLTESSCSLIRLGWARGGRVVRAFRTIPVGYLEPGRLTDELRRLAWPLKSVGSTRVVLWNAVGLEAPEVEACIRPVRDGGFRVETVVTPTAALLTLAAQRVKLYPDNLAACLALHRDGVALAIVERDRIVFGGELEWHYHAGDESSAKGRLLNRYVLIAELAPQIEQAFRVVKEKTRRDVTYLATCGNLPDLRSLTMPLIEELDIEVETLDAPDVLDATRLPEPTDRFREAWPGLRLAWAVAARKPKARLLSTSVATRARNAVRAVRTNRSLRPAASALAVALLIGMSWFAIAQWPTGPRSSPSSVSARHETAPVAARNTPKSAPSRAPANDASARPTVQPQAPSMVPPAAPIQPPQTAAAPAPRVTTAPPPRTGAARAPNTRIRSRERGTGAQGAGTVARARPARRIEDAPPPPGIHVESILFAQNRRLAVINGRIVSVGDFVRGIRVVDIGPDTVVLHLPRGRLIRVRLGDTVREGQP